MATPLTTVTTQALSSHLAQVFAQYPIEVAHGDGVWLHARDGRKILDFYGGAAGAGVGAGRPRRAAPPAPPARRSALFTHAPSPGARRRGRARPAPLVWYALVVEAWVIK